MIKITKKHQLTGHNASVFALQTGASDHHFLSGAGEGWVAQWDLQDPEMGKLVAKIDTQIFSLANLVEFQTIVIGNMNGGVHWVNLSDESKNRDVLHHKKGVFGILQLNDEIFTVGGGGVLSRWSIAEQRAVEGIALSSQSLRCVAYNTKTNDLAVGASDNHIYILNPKDFTFKRTLKNAHGNSVFSLEFSPNGALLFSGGRDAHLRVWDVWNDYQQISEQPAHYFTINSIVAPAGETWLATGSRDKTIKIWDAASFELLKVLETVRDKGHVNSVNALHWNAAHRTLISTGDDRSIILWEVE